MEARLYRIAAARGVPVADRDDLVQEVAARVLSTGVAYESADDLLPWAAAVLRRAHVDSHRHHERFPLASDMTTESANTDRVVAADVACTVVARLDLAAIGETVAAWPADARRALFSDERGEGRQTSAFYVRRHRLRARLLQVIDGVGAWTGVRRIETAAELLAPVTAHAPVAAAACLTLVLAMGGGHSPRHGPALAEPASGQAVEVAARIDTVAAAATAGIGDSPAAGGPSRAAANGDATSTARPPVEPAPRSSSMVYSPVEPSADVEAADQHPSVEVENRDDDHPPMVCTDGELTPGGCRDWPVYPRDHVPLPI